jgi:ABC-type glycerol-3-phosphate transport system substrate-binding protein
MEPGTWDIAHMPKGPKDRACMGLPDQWVIYKGTIDRGTKEASWEFMKFLQGEWYQQQIAVVATRIPGLLSAADAFVASMRETIPALEQVDMEVLPEMLAMGYPRGAQVFRYQQVAEELIQPAMDAVFVEGKEPVTIFQDVADQVTQAQQEAHERAQA